jgi:hypothetical protein
MLDFFAVQSGGRAGARSSTRRRDYGQRVLVGVAVERENQSALRTTSCTPKE